MKTLISLLAVLGAAVTWVHGEAGKAAVEVWEGLESRDISSMYPQEIPWRFPDREPRRLTLPIGELGTGKGYTMSRVRMIVTAPEDGYRSLAVGAGGWYQVLLSDDGTPETLRPLWNDGELGYNIAVGFDAAILRADGPWRYFKKDEPRLMEVRYLHLTGPNFMKLAWTGAGGKRAPIPPECVKFDVPAPQDGDGTQPDGIWRGLLAGDGVRVAWDWKTAKPLTTGWSEFDGGNESVLKSAHDPETRASLAGGGLATVFGGDLEVPFETAREGFGVLALRVQLCNGFGSFAHMEVERIFDGVSLGREVLRAPDGETRLFRTVTPWLEKGAHTLRLRMWQSEQWSSARLCGSFVEMPAEADFVEWIGKKLASLNAFLPERGDNGFLRSPACVEFSSRTSEGPLVTAAGKNFPVRQATMNSWWADMPLPESGAPVAVRAEFSADRTVATANPRWLETRIGEHPELWVRAGDSLRIAALPPEVKGAKSKVTMGGETRGGTWIYRFDVPGETVVEGSYEAEGGGTVVSKMIVKTIARTTDEPEMLLQRRDTAVRMRIDRDAWPDGGDFSAFRRYAGDAHWPAGSWKAGHTSVGKACRARCGRGRWGRSAGWSGRSRRTCAGGAPGTTARTSGNGPPIHWWRISCRTTGGSSWK